MGGLVTAGLSPEQRSTHPYKRDRPVIVRALSRCAAIIMLGLEQTRALKAEGLSCVTGSILLDRFGPNALDVTWRVVVTSGSP